MVGSLVDEVENLVSDCGGIVIHDDTIECIAESSELASEYLTGEIGEQDEPILVHQGTDTTIWDISGHAVIPGFVDAHTHLLWAGDRSRDVMWQQSGFSYSEIAGMGGGIGHTVHSTRSVSETKLLNRPYRAFNP